MIGSGKWCKEDGNHGLDGGAIKTFKEGINYIQKHLSLIHALPNSSTRPPPKPHTNDPVEESGCTGHDINAPTTIVNTR